MQQKIRKIIVQAGGRGSRMGYLTDHKPKCLVPVDNRPVLFHLMERYPDCRFLIIGDYQVDVLERYLMAFAPAPFQVIRAFGRGNCAGLRQALESVEDDEPFALIWSDLILGSGNVLKEAARMEGDCIGVAPGLSCRYRFRAGRVEPVASDTDGVAGLFVFRRKAVLDRVPPEGEFADFLVWQAPPLVPLILEGAREVGTLAQFEQAFSGEHRSRSFNRVVMEADRVRKEPLDEQGRMLAGRETLWYREVARTGFDRMPRILGEDPLVLERIEGFHPFQLDRARAAGLSPEAMLPPLMDLLADLHSRGRVPADQDGVLETYARKTFHRLDQIRDLVPGAADPLLTVNGKRCMGAWALKEEMAAQAARMSFRTFTVIHGDPTFSNILFRSDGSGPVLLDPRGYFGREGIHGDPAYDYAKLYYSLVGRYDKVNRGEFRLRLEDTGIWVDVAPNGWEALGEAFFDRLPPEVPREDVLFLHGVIWLSVTTYFRENYDAICAAYYLGCYHLQLWKEALDANPTARSD